MGRAGKQQNQASIPVYLDRLSLYSLYTRICSQLALRPQRLCFRYRYMERIQHALLICAVMFAVGYYVTYTGFSTTAANPNATETEMELYFTFCSPNVLLMTLAAFLLMKKVVVNTPVVVKALANMTKCGFGIYMVHYFVVGPFFLLIGPSEIPIPLQVPLMAVCIFLCSWAFTAAVYKVIPKKAKYFMG